MTFMRILITLAILPLMSGCISAATAIVKAPFQVVGKAADVMTTSQSEADEKRGRDLRKQEEALGKLARQRDKYARKCRDDKDEDACEKVRDIEDEIEDAKNT
jgi:hypothetical protein